MSSLVLLVVNFMSFFFFFFLKPLEVLELFVAAPHTVPFPFPEVGFPAYPRILSAPDTAKHVLARILEQRPAGSVS